MPMRTASHRRGGILQPVEDEGVQKWCAVLYGITSAARPFALNFARQRNVFIRLQDLPPLRDGMRPLVRRSDVDRDFYSHGKASMRQGEIAVAALGCAPSPEGQGPASRQDGGIHLLPQRLGGNNSMSSVVLGRASRRDQMERSALTGVSCSVIVAE